MCSPPSFYLICREATTCGDSDRWRVIAVRDGKVVEDLDDLGYESLQHAVTVYRKLHLPIYSPQGLTNAS